MVGVLTGVLDGLDAGLFRLVKMGFELDFDTLVGVDTGVGWVVGGVALRL